MPFSAYSAAEWGGNGSHKHVWVRPGEPHRTRCDRPFSAGTGWLLCGRAKGRLLLDGLLFEARARAHECCGARATKAGTSMVMPVCMWRPRQSNPSPPAHPST